MRTDSAASTATNAAPAAATSPALPPVAARCTTARPWSAESARSPRRWPRARGAHVPQGLSRAAEKITAASAMSSTMRGAAGPTGTGCSASRSPSTTPTVSRVASRLNGAPPTGASDSATGGESSASSFDWQCHPTHGGQQFPQRQFGRQRHVGHPAALGMVWPACGEHGDADDRHRRHGRRRQRRGAGQLTVCRHCCCSVLSSKSRVRCDRGNHGPSGSVPVSRSIAAAIASGVPELKVDNHFPVERVRRCDEHPARGGVDEADADLGADAVTVAMVTRDDLDVAAVRRKGRLHHGACGLRDAQEVDDVRERSAGAQPLVGTCADPRRDGELVEARRRPSGQACGQNRDERLRVVDVQCRERDQLRCAAPPPSGPRAARRSRAAGFPNR